MSRSVVVDISERSRLEAERAKVELALRDSQHFIQQVAETVPYLLAVYDLTQQRIIYSNRSLGEVLGYSTAETEGMGDRILTLLKHPDKPDYGAQTLALQPIL